jgi:hypothetical protein
MFSYPNNDSVRVTVYSGLWNRLLKQSFPMGNRRFLSELAVVKDRTLKQSLIKVRIDTGRRRALRMRHMWREEHRGDPAFPKSADPEVDKYNDPVVHKEDYYHQYYALLFGGFVLVRLENNEGEIVPNRYYFKVADIGPPVIPRTRDRWIESLTSPNPVEQLSTLVWLSGDHQYDKEAPFFGWNERSARDKMRFKDSQESLKFKQALEQLVTSDNKWIQEYSKLTLALIEK